MRPFPGIELVMFPQAFLIGAIAIWAQSFEPSGATVAVTFLILEAIYLIALIAAILLFYSRPEGASKGAEAISGQCENADQEAAAAPPARH